MTWRRTTLAALAGILFGYTVGALLLIRDLHQIEALSGGEITRVGGDPPAARSPGRARTESTSSR